jgi:hypothetical protein
MPGCLHSRIHGNRGGTPYSRDLAAALPLLRGARRQHVSSGMSLRIEHLATRYLPQSSTRALVALCDAAFNENSAAYFRDIGPGEHLLGWDNETLATHLMWVPRTLVVGRLSLRTAYIEQVATAGSHGRRGYASQLLGMLPPLLASYDIAALSPATESLYLRLGWQYWEGPLSHRKDGEGVPDPEERVMVLPLPRTPTALDRKAPLSIEWRPGDVW